MIVVIVKKTRPYFEKMNHLYLFIGFKEELACHAGLDRHPGLIKVLIYIKSH